MNVSPWRDFTVNFIQLNGLEKKFSGWHFAEGMSFNDASKWWGDRGIRKTPHEGIDLANYVDLTQEIKWCKPGSLVPPLLEGKIMAIFPDFLGKSILCKHDVLLQDFHLYSVLGHLAPMDGIDVGYCCHHLDLPIAKFAHAERNSTVPSHLHISTFWSQKHIDANALSWAAITASSEKNIFIDPLSLLVPEVSV